MLVGAAGAGWTVVSAGDADWSGASATSGVARSLNGAPHPVQNRAGPDRCRPHLVQKPMPPTPFAGRELLRRSYDSKDALALRLDVPFGQFWEISSAEG